jgi:hypothetical protein
MVSIKLKVQLLMKLEKGVSVNASRQRYAPEPEICFFDSQPSQVRGPAPVVEFEIA